MNRLVLVTSLILLGAHLSLAQEKPNIVCILADDCTFRDIGCYGGQAYTPHIDRLARQGMRFRRCFQAAAMCSPTRHCLYTGLYPVKSGAYPNHAFAKEGTKSIVHYLKPLGYRVVLCGKSHVAPRNVFPFEYFRSSGELPLDAVDDVLGEAASTGQPVCLFACSFQPHAPWDKGDPRLHSSEDVQLPPYLADTPQTRNEFERYLTEVNYFDKQVGRILKSIDKHQLTDNTLVVLLSEQGNAFPFAKWTCYDGGLGSAMIVRWPGRVEKGSVTNAMVEYVDLCPTFVKAAGGIPDPALDGESLLPVLFGEKQQHKEYVYGVMTTRGIQNGSSAYPIRSIRSERYKLILNLNHTAGFQNNITVGTPQMRHFNSWVQAAASGNKKARQLVSRFRHRPEVEFYDVVKDPLEMNNLADNAKYADEIETLRQRLLDWMESQGDAGMETELAAHEHQVNKGR